MTMEKNEINIKCECCSHAVEFSHDEEMGQVEISLWNYGHSGTRLSFRERIRWSWHILVTGNPWVDMVTLNYSKMDKVMKWYAGIKINKKSDKVLLKG